MLRVALGTVCRKAGEWVRPGHARHRSRHPAVVAHGVATGVLVEAGDGAVRARYAD